MMGIRENPITFSHSTSRVIQAIPSSFTNWQAVVYNVLLITHLKTLQLTHIHQWLWPLTINRALQLKLLFLIWIGQQIMKLGPSGALRPRYTSQGPFTIGIIPLSNVQCHIDDTMYGFTKDSITCDGIKLRRCSYLSHLVSLTVEIMRESSWVVSSSRKYTDFI